jgi:hypothetical protein
MKMLTKIHYNRDINKYIDCVICLKEFEENE